MYKIWAGRPNVSITCDIASSDIYEHEVRKSKPNLHYLKRGEIPIQEIWKSAFLVVTNGLTVHFLCYCLGSFSNFQCTTVTVRHKFLYGI